MTIRLVVTFIICLIQVTQSIQLLPSNHTKCDLKLAFVFPEIKDSIVLDLDDDSDSELKTCLIKKLFLEQSVHLLKGHNISSERELKRVQNTVNSNVIIMTNTLHNSLLDYPSVNVISSPNWSLVSIILTNKDIYTCDNGSMNETVFFNLEMILNNIWHKFKTARVTVVFPYACKNRFIVYSNKIPNNQELYDRSIKLVSVANIEGLTKAVIDSGAKLSEHYPLRANIFYRFPTSITECTCLQYYARDINLNRSDGFCGLDGLVMHDIVKQFKFKLFYPKDKDCQKYGYADSKKIAGSLGCIIRKELDISFNSRFVRMYSADNVNFLHFITTDSLCALTSQMDNIPLWHYVFDVFRAKQWVILIILLTATGLTMWLAAQVRNKISGEKPRTVMTYIAESIFSTLFGISSLAGRSSYALLRATCLLCSIFFVAVYQSHVNYVFTTVSRYEAISTLEELYASGHILYTSPTMRDMLKEIAHPGNVLEQRFINTSRLLPGNRIGYILRNPNTVTMGRKMDTMLEILLSYTDEEGLPMINIIRECYGSFYLSYIARPGFAFIEHLQKFIERLRQAGLPKMYYIWTRRALGVPDSAITAQAAHSGARVYTSITLSDQRGAFVILAVGYLVSTVAFVVELWRARSQIVQ